MTPAYVESGTSQVTYVGESTATPSDVRQLSREGVRNDWRDEITDKAVDCSHTSCWPCHDPVFISPTWFSAPPRLWNRDQTFGGANCCIVQVTSNNIIVLANEHFLCEDGAS